MAALCELISAGLIGNFYTFDQTEWHVLNLDNTYNVYLARQIHRTMIHAMFLKINE